MKRRLRIALVVENMPVPADRRVWQEAVSLSAAGHDVDVVCPRGTTRDLAPYEEREGVRIHRYPAPGSAQGVIGYAREYAAAVHHIRRTIRRLSKEKRFDVIQVCNPPDFLWLAVAREKLGGTKIVFDHHDLFPELYASRFGDHRLPLALLGAMERAAFAAADVVISTNESYRRVAMDRGRKNPGDVFVVRNAPDIERFRPVAPQPGLAHGKSHLIAYVGVMGPQDGVDNAIHALHALSEVRDDWYALFLGNGSEFHRLNALTARLGLTDRVGFGGWADDDAILPALSTADVCLAPEGASPLNNVSTMMKVAEYMAFGRPVVAFDLLETRRTAGEAAVYAKPGDVQEYSRCISDLLDDESARARRGTIGLERVRAELSWESSAVSLVAAYDRAGMD